MTKPTSIADIDFLQPQGPVHVVSGNLYAVVRDASSLDAVKCIKSTDNGDTWSEVDAANRPSVASAVFMSVHTRLSGSLLLIHLQNDNRNKNGYVEFETATDTWGTYVEIGGRCEAEEWVTMPGPRSDGDKLATYSFAEKVMGTEYARPGIARNEGAGWTFDINASAAGSVERQQIGATGITTANDRTHVAFVDGSNGLRFSTYLSDNTFGHQDTLLDASADATGQAAFIDVILFDDSGTLKVRWLYSRGGDLYICGFDGDSDSPTPITPIGPINDNASPDSAALTHIGNVQHLVYSVGAAQYSTKTGAGDDTWEADTEIRASGGGVIYAANVYDNGGDVLAFLYDDSGGTETYDEVSLGADTRTVDLAATLPALTSSADADVGVAADLAGTLPGLTASFDTGVLAAADFAATLPILNATFEVGPLANVELAATLPAFTATFDTSATATADLAGTLPTLTATADADVAVQADLAGTLPALTASMNAGVLAAVDFAATLPSLTASADVGAVATADLAATLPGLTAIFDAKATATADLVATLPALTGTADASVTVAVDLAGTLPSLAASVDAGVTVAADLGATLPLIAASADVTASEERTVDLAATLPAMEAALDVTAAVEAVAPFATKSILLSRRVGRGFMYRRTG